MSIALEAAIDAGTADERAAVAAALEAPAGPAYRQDLHRARCDLAAAIRRENRRATARA